MKIKNSQPGRYAMGLMDAAVILLLVTLKNSQTGQRVHRCRAQTTCFTEHAFIVDKGVV